MLNWFTCWSLVKSSIQYTSIHQVYSRIQCTIQQCMGCFIPWYVLVLRWFLCFVLNGSLNQFPVTVAVHMYISIWNHASSCAGLVPLPKVPGYLFIMQQVFLLYLNLNSLNESLFLSLELKHMAWVLSTANYWQLMVTLHLNGLFQKLNAHPLKKALESQKFYSHVSLGIPKNLGTFLVARVEKTWKFPEFLIVFYKQTNKQKGIPIFVF